MPSKFQIAKAVNIIRNGGVIAYATEAVYGLGCDPENAHAIQRILDLKQRKAEQGLILIASSLTQVRAYLDPLSVDAETAIASYWPGPTTLIMPASSQAPYLITGGRETIAIRITDHPDTRRLCDALGHPLVSTSANQSGQPAMHYPWQLANVFGDALDYIFPSRLGGLNKPSQIIDIENNKILRQA